MKNAHLQLQAAADLQRYHDTISSLIELGILLKEKDVESARKVAKIMGEVDTLLTIHRSRSLDYFDLVEKIDIARDEYRTLKRIADDFKKKSKELQKKVDKLMNEKL